MAEIAFQFFRLKFSPYRSSGLKSETIFKNALNHLLHLKKEGKGILIDRFEGRESSSRRELWINRVIWMHKERRVRCAIALLRDGINPKVKPDGEFELKPLRQLKGTIAEETHFFVDYSGNSLIVCMEFNYYGPRMSDLEYYLRQIANNHTKEAKATKMSMFMDVPIDETLAKLKNVLSLDIKVQPRNFAQMDTHLVGEYFSGMNTIGNKLKPRTLKVSASFHTPGQNVRSSELNTHANNLVKDLLRTFKGRAFHIDLFDHFGVEYHDKEGSDNVFNLLRGKKEVRKDINIDTLQKERDWYELVEREFDQFMDEL